MRVLAQRGGAHAARSGGGGVPGCGPLCRNARSSHPRFLPRCGSTVGNSVPKNDEELLTSDEDQKRIAAVADIILVNAKAALVEKRQSYESQLEEVERDSRANVFYRALNSWTVRLLKRKIAFTSERISKMERLEEQVLSCSLDGNCTFSVSVPVTESNIPEISQFASESWFRTLKWSTDFGPSPLIEFAKTSRQLADTALEKDVSATVLLSEKLDASNDIKEALQKASEKASKHPGAKVVVERSYPYLGFQGLPLTVKSDDKVNMYPETTDAMRVASGMFIIVKVAFSSFAAALVAWLFHLADVWDTLHWNALVPVRFEDARTLVFWTMPFVAAYVALGGVRELHRNMGAGSQLGIVGEGATVMTDHLQATGRSQFPTFVHEDARIVYFLSAVGAHAVAAPWVYGVLLNLVRPVYTADLVVTNDPASTIMRNMLASPSTAFTVAVVAGLVSLVRKVATDSMTDEKGRDSTRVVDDLITTSMLNPGDARAQSLDVELAKFRLRSTVPGKFILNESLGSTLGVVRSRIEAIVRSTGVGEDDVPVVTQAAISKLQQAAPAQVTVDFKSAVWQSHVNRQREWLEPVAIMLSTFYLALEVAVTKEIAFAVFTQVAAVSMLDALERPWDKNTVDIKVSMEDPSKAKKVYQVVEGSEGQ